MSTMEAAICLLVDQKQVNRNHEQFVNTYMCGK